MKPISCAHQRKLLFSACRPKPQAEAGPLLAAAQSRAGGTQTGLLRLNHDDRYVVMLNGAAGEFFDLTLDFFKQGVGAHRLGIFNHS